MAPATISALTLNNCVAMPPLGLGVFQSPPEETTAAVEAALRTGYRLIDTAAAYGNEREVGDAVVIARAHGKSPAQVMLRWGLQHGRSVIPKSVRAERIAEDFDVFYFALSADQRAAIADRD